MIFWGLAPCTLVGRCQRFGETYYLHLQDRRSRQMPPFQGNVMSPSSGLKMQIVFFRSIGIYRRVYTRQNPEERHTRRRRNLRAHDFIVMRSSAPQLSTLPFSFRFTVQNFIHFSHACLCVPLMSSAFCLPSDVRQSVQVVKLLVHFPRFSSHVLSFRPDILSPLSSNAFNL
jgi:hypothetical protein